MSLYKPNMFPKMEFGNLILTKKILKKIYFDIFSSYKKNYFSLKVNLETFPYFIFDGYWQDRILSFNKKIFDILSDNDPKIKKRLIKIVNIKHLRNPYIIGRQIISFLKKHNKVDPKKLKYFNLLMKKIYMERIQYGKYKKSYVYKKKFIYFFYEKMKNYVEKEEQLNQLIKIFFKYITFDLKNTLSYELRKIHIKEEYIEEIKQNFFKFARQKPDIALILFNKKKITVKNILNIFGLKNTLKEIDNLFNYSIFIKENKKIDYLNKKMLYSYMLREFLEDKGLNFDNFITLGKESKEYKYLNNLMFFYVIGTIFFNFNEEIIKEIIDFTRYLKTFNYFLKDVLSEQEYVHLCTSLDKKIFLLEDISYDENILRKFEKYKKEILEKDKFIGNNFTLNEPLLKNYTLTEYFDFITKNNKNLNLDNLQYEYIIPGSIYLDKNYSVLLTKKTFIYFKKDFDFILNIIEVLYELEEDSYISNLIVLLKEKIKEFYDRNNKFLELNNNLLDKNEIINGILFFYDKTKVKKEKIFIKKLYLFYKIHKELLIKTNDSFFEFLIDFFENEEININKLNNFIDTFLSEWKFKINNFNLDKKIKIFIDYQIATNGIETEFLYRNLKYFFFMEDEYIEFLEKLNKTDNKENQISFLIKNNSKGFKEILLMLSDVLKYPEHKELFFNKEALNMIFINQMKFLHKDILKLIRIIKDLIINSGGYSSQRHINLIIKIENLIEKAIIFQTEKNYLEELDKAILNSKEMVVYKQDFDFLLNLFNGGIFYNISLIKEMAEKKERLDFKYNTEKLLFLSKNYSYYYSYLKYFSPILSKNRNILLNIAFNDKEKLQIMKYILNSPLKRDLFYMNITKKEKRFLTSIKRKTDLFYHVFSFLKIEDLLNEIKEDSLSSKELEEIFFYITKNNNEFYKNIYKNNSLLRKYTLIKIFKKLKNNSSFFQYLMYNYPNLMYELLNDNEDIQMLNKYTLKPKGPYYLIDFKIEKTENGLYFAKIINTELYNEKYVEIFKRNGAIILDNYLKFIEEEKEEKRKFLDILNKEKENLLSKWNNFEKKLSDLKIENKTNKVFLIPINITKDNFSLFYIDKNMIIKDLISQRNILFNSSLEINSYLGNNKFYQNDYIKCINFYNKKKKEVLDSITFFIKEIKKV